MQQSLIDFYNYLDIAYRRKWLIVIPVLMLTAVGVIMAITLPPHYRSTTIIRVEKQQVPEAYVTPTDRTPFSERLNTMRQQIMSRQKLEKIINDSRLYQDSSFGNFFNATLKKLGIKIKTSSFSKEEMLDRMTSDIEAKVIGGSSGDAFSISYIGTDPNTTMQVTDTLASLFIEENLKAREQYAEGTSDFLANELENAKKELEAQERAVRGFKEKYRGALPEELDANLRTLDRLQMELQSINVEEKNAEDRKIILASQLNQTVNTQGHTGMVATGSPGNPLADELQRLQQTLASLLSEYKETYPDVIITKKRINEIKDLLAKSNDQKKDQDNSKRNPDEFAEIKPEVRNPEVYNNLIVVKAQIATLKQREAEIRRQIKEFEKRVDETPANEQKFVNLRRDYDISLKNYQTLLEKKLNAKLSENLEKRQKGERFTIIDPANLPGKPFRPNRPMIAAAGFAAGLGAGIGLVFLFELMNPAFRSPEDFEGVTELPVLASIPEFSSASKKRYGKNFRLIKGKKAGVL